MDRKPSGAGSMLVLDSLAVADFALIDAEGETTVGIGAGPRLEDDGCALLPIVRQRDQDPVVAFLALGKFHHPSSRKTDPDEGRVEAGQPSNLDKQRGVSKHRASRDGRLGSREMPPRGIEPLPQAPEACVISISPRGREE